MHGLGGNTFTDNTWNGGRVGFLHTSATNDTVTRTTIRLAETAASVEGGTLTIDNSVIDLGSTGQTGLRAGTDASAGATSIDARQLTVFGGATGSRGVWAFAAAPTAVSSVTLANSIARGSTDSLVASASNSGTATLTVHHSDYQAVDEVGAGVVSEGAGNLDVDPGFLNAASGDYSLRAGAAIVDKGDSSVVTPRDRVGSTRAFDGDSNGSPVPDMGAYELVDVTAPKTVITGGPSGPTNDNTPVFTVPQRPGRHLPVPDRRLGLPAVQQPGHDDTPGERRALLRRSGPPIRSSTSSRARRPAASPSTPSRQTPGSPRGHRSASSRRR